MRFIAFGSKWYADEVFKDKIPRTLPELFKPETLEIMLGYEENPVSSRIYPAPQGLGSPSPNTKVNS